MQIQEPISDMDTEKLRTIAAEFACQAKVHRKDFIYDFLSKHAALGQDPERYYFTDGRRSAERFVELIGRTASFGGRPYSVLEFASGYGCVTRHLRNLLPAENIIACDIHAEAMQFIDREIGVRTMISTHSPADFDLGRRFDVVFALSFFSHMPDRTFGAWLAALFGHVEPGGRLIFTTHGAVSHRKLMPFAELSDGYWFNPDSEQLDLEAAEYGTAISTPEYVSQQIFKHLTRPHCISRARLLVGASGRIRCRKTRPTKQTRWDCPSP